MVIRRQIASEMRIFKMSPRSARKVAQRADLYYIYTHILTTTTTTICSTRSNIRISFALYNFLLLGALNKKKENKKKMCSSNQCEWKKVKWYLLYTKSNLLKSAPLVLCLHLASADQMAALTPDFIWKWFEAKWNLLNSLLRFALLMENIIYCIKEKKLPLNNNWFCSRSCTKKVQQKSTLLQLMHSFIYLYNCEYVNIYIYVYV